MRDVAVHEGVYVCTYMHVRMCIVLQAGSFEDVQDVIFMEEPRSFSSSSSSSLFSGGALRTHKHGKQASMYINISVCVCALKVLCICTDWCVNVNAWLSTVLKIERVYVCVYGCNSTPLSRRWLHTSL